VRRPAVIAAALLGAVVLAGCNSQGVTSATPKTVIGTLPKAPTFPIVPAFHLKGDPTKGKAVFASSGCGSCHTLAAAGTKGVVGPNLDTDLRKNCATAQSKSIRGATLEDCIRTAITKPYAYIPAGYQAGVMPSDFSHTLTADEITALVNFLSTAAK
jgi:cytochrome c2